MSDADLRNAAELGHAKRLEELLRQGANANGANPVSIIYIALSGYTLD